MSIDYTYNLCVGFKISQSDFDKAFMRKESQEGKFHFEDRFDPKTGLKLDKQEKVWDKRPTSYTYYSLTPTGKEYSYSLYEGILAELEEFFEAFVEIFDVDGEDYISISVHKNNRTYNETVNVNASPISFKNLISYQEKLVKVKEKLEFFGLNVGEPEIFVTQWMR